jgi:O-antigen ligase
MALPYRASGSDTNEVFVAGKSSKNESPVTKVRWTQHLDNAIFGFLALFAILLPHSVKGAERSWKIALVLWLSKLVIGRMRPYMQPLTLPLLVYLVLSAISTILSPEPFLSWDRMKVVCLLLAGVVVAQNLRRLHQVRWLTILLVLSALAAALFTGWQYTYGIGVRLTAFPDSSRLAQAGFQQSDIVQSLNGKNVHTPEQLVRAVNEAAPLARVTVTLTRGEGFHPTKLTATPHDFVESGIGTPSMKLDRGKPNRAQGTLSHYVVFAEVLMQVGCMAWVLLLGTSRSEIGWKLVFLVAFAAIVAALLVTGTRAAVAGLVLGCFLSLALLAARRARVFAIVALAVIVAGATIWIQHTRETRWVDPADISTHFRVLMWQDGIRLIRQHPLFGVGMETVRLHYREWNIRGFIQYNVVSHFHSTYVQIAVERGIPALIAWLWFCIAYGVFLWQLISRARTQSRFASAIAVGALAGLIAFCFTSLFHYNLGEETVAMMFYFYFGLVIAIDRMLASPGAIDVP